jgi:hypothetical protein
MLCFLAIMLLLLCAPVCPRFSAPSKRSSSLRFSRCMVLAPHAPSGYWALGLRVANMRKHIMIRPEVRHRARLITTVTGNAQTLGLRIIGTLASSAFLACELSRASYVAAAQHLYGQASTTCRVLAGMACATQRM